MADSILNLVFARKDVSNFCLNTLTNNYEIVFKNGTVKSFTNIKALKKWLEENK